LKPCTASPASGSPNSLPLIEQRIGRWRRVSRQAGPSSSGVTQTGVKTEAGFERVKPNIRCSSTACKLRSDTSLTSITSSIFEAATAGLAPYGTSLVTTATSPSKSTPQSSLPIGTSWVGARKPSERP
jgi:hypothetical protein